MTALPHNQQRRLPNETHHHRDRAGSGHDAGTPYPLHLGSSARRPTTLISADGAELRQRLKDYLAEMLEQLLGRANGLVSIGVSGGSMPRVLCDVFKSLEDIKWKRVRIFMVDERYVEPTDPQSNYGQYAALLPPHIQEALVQVPIMDNVQKTAMAYEAQLRGACQAELIGKLPRFDILFLGIGPDGHTCSIFPGDKLHKMDPCVTSQFVFPVVESPKPPPKRVTIGLNSIRVAKNVAFIITGEEKAGVVKGILSGDPQYPATQVKPMNHRLTFFMDTAAASKLTPDFLSRDEQTVGSGGVKNDSPSINGGGGASSPLRHPTVTPGSVPALHALPMLPIVNKNTTNHHHTQHHTQHHHHQKEEPMDDE